MTIGDDGIASICMGKQHVGNPCENCGHENEAESKRNPPKRPYCFRCHGKGWFSGLEVPCAWCNPGGEFRAI